MSKLNYLNIGCGTRYHPDWVNIDLYETGPGVIATDILKGLPFADGTFDAVYHSHVLEHFSRPQARDLIRECGRVLRPGGVLRVVVPDLEGIVREYLKQLELARSGEPGAERNYDWMMLELIDQMVRDRTGGDMLEYLSKPDLENEEFVFGRLGRAAREGRRHILEDAQKRRSAPASVAPSKGSLGKRIRNLASSRKWRRRLERWLLHDDLRLLDLGRFMRAGEPHLWMYDPFSLGRLFGDYGFVDVRTRTAFESALPGWRDFQLDTNGDDVVKPDSLFMEGVKP